MKKVDASEKDYLKKLIQLFKNEADYDEAVKEATSYELKSIFKKYPVRYIENKSLELKVYVDRKKALFSTWYEFFPRSSSEEQGKHGTFKDCERLLPRVAAMGLIS